MPESLDETKNKILAFTEKNNLNLFYGFISINNKVVWDSTKEDLDNFLKISLNEQITTLVYEELCFKEEFENIKTILKNNPEETDNNTQLFSELKSTIECYQKHSDELFCINVGWIKEGIKYSFQKIAPWFKEYLALKEELQELLKASEKEVVTKKTLGATKKKLDDLTKEIFEWGKSKKLNKITRANLNIYLIENEIAMTWANKEALRSLVNKKLNE